jgi:hypothetical protein
VFEDLHWADEALLDFVDELVDWVTDVPMLVVATARPELLERRAELGRRQAQRDDARARTADRRRDRRLLGSVLAPPVIRPSRRRLLERAAATRSTRSSSPSCSSSAARRTS